MYTRAADYQFLQKYKSMNTRVEDKSGEELVNIISENVGRMLRRKMDAVTCIRIAAEEAAENWDPFVVDALYETDKYDEKTGNFSYISGKCSPVVNDDSAEENDDGDNSDEEEDINCPPKNDTRWNVYRQAIFSVIARFSLLISYLESVTR